LQVSGTK